MQPKTEGTQYRDQFGTEWSTFGVQTATRSFGYRAVLRATVDGSDVVVLVNRDNANDIYHLIECESPTDEPVR